MYMKKNNRSHKGKGSVNMIDDYVMLDIETTGFSPINDEIIEIGALKVVDNVIVDTFDMLVRPNGWISSFITSLTGISNTMVGSADAIDIVLPKFLAFAGDSIIVGHNISFDINFIYDNSMRFLQKPFCNDYVNTVMLCNRVFPHIKSKKLSYLSEYFSIDNDNAHRALADCHATKQLYDIIRDRVYTKGITLGR